MKRTVLAMLLATMTLTTACGSKVPEPNISEAEAVVEETPEEVAEDDAEPVTEESSVEPKNIKEEMFTYGDVKMVLFMTENHSASIMLTTEDAQKGAWAYVVAVPYVYTDLQDLNPSVALLCNGAVISTLGCVDADGKHINETDWLKENSGISEDDATELSEKIRADIESFFAEFL